MLQSDTCALKSNKKKESEEVKKEFKKSRKMEGRVGEENLMEEEIDEDKIVKLKPDRTRT